MHFLWIRIGHEAEKHYLDAVLFAKLIENRELEQKIEEDWRVDNQ
ncbi:hypothetical protein SSU98_0053 [Streptococcus suis 98HAH33]|nr:hypothetical protein SSU98_0053 [Streptococcus suis 98HAH33]